MLKKRLFLPDEVLESLWMDVGNDDGVPRLGKLTKEHGFKDGTAECQNETVTGEGGGPLPHHQFHVTQDTLLQGITVLGAQRFAPVSPVTSKIDHSPFWK